MSDQQTVKCQECQWLSSTANQTGAHCTGVNPPDTDHECVAFKQRSTREQKK